MTSAADLAAPEATARRRDRAGLFVWGLGLTQIVGYGTLYYGFSLLAPGIARELGWSSGAVFGAFSLALLAGGLAAPLAGRWIDRAGAGRALTIGSALAALALAALALLPGPAGFVGALVAAEAASTLVLYEAAFALLVQVLPAAAARRAITHLTLIAGFASTLFWPLTAALLAAFTWREVYLLFAGLNLLLCVPVHALLAARAGAARAAEALGPAAQAGDAGVLPAGLRPRAFRLVLAGFTLGGFVLSALLVHMVPVMTALGLGASAVMIGSLFGPAQVLGRLVNMGFGGGLSPVSVALVSAGLVPAAIALLALAPTLAGALVFALLFGLGSGLASIVRGTVPLHLFGRAGYGTRQGQLTSARLVATALAPFAFALLADRAGMTAALWAMVAVAGLGAAAFVPLLRIR